MFDEGEKEASKEEEEKEKRDKKGQQREDCVKVALVDFLEGVLLSANVTKNISNFYTSIVENLAMFNAYP